MNTTKHESHGAVAGQVDCRVRPCAPLTEAEIEDCIDAANRKFNGRRMGPCGQMMTTYDDWKHWLVREIEAAHGIGGLTPEFMQAQADEAPRLDLGA